MDDLAPDDFEALRVQIAKTYGKLSRKVEIKTGSQPLPLRLRCQTDRQVPYGLGRGSSARAGANCAVNGSRMGNACSRRPRSGPCWQRRQCR